MVTSIIREEARRVAETLGDRLTPLQGATVLVTGAGGFVGSFFVDVLNAFNHRDAGPPCRVVAMDNHMIGLPGRVAHLRDEPAIRFIRHDVSKPLPLDCAPDYVAHFAGIASPLFYRAFPLETIAVNVDGTRNVLELARHGTRSLLTFSSSEIYGDPDPQMVPTPETYRGNVSCIGPRACYDESKRIGETLSSTYHTLYGLQVKIVRPFNVYGPGQRIDDGRIIPDLMKAAVAGGPLVLLSDGRATRSFCYVGDFVEGSLRLLLAEGGGGEAFNLGNDHQISIRGVAELMAEVAACPPLAIEFHSSGDPDYLVDNPQRRCPDLTKITALTGWRPRTALRDGLTRTLASYREEAAAPAVAAVAE